MLMKVYATEEVSLSLQGWQRKHFGSGRGNW